VKVTRLARLAAGAFFVLSAAAFAQFEGVAEFDGKVQAGKTDAVPSHGKVYLSKTACRVEWETELPRPASGSSEPKKSSAPSRYRLVMLQRASEPDRTYMLNDERHTYAVVKGEAAEKSSRKYSVKRLGHDTVAGVGCEKALVASDAEEMEICVATSLVPSAAWLAAMNRRPEHSDPLAALKRDGLNGFPIRWTFHTTKEDEASSTIELVRFEKKSLPSSLFQIPPGYKEASASSVAMTSAQQRSYDDAKRKAYASMTPEQRREAADKLRKAMEKMSPEERKRMEEQLKELEDPQ
jgi:Domain of unknown function (DUF4412)